MTIAQLKKQTPKLIGLLIAGMVVYHLVLPVFFPFSACFFQAHPWQVVRETNDHEELQNKSYPRRCMVTDLQQRYLYDGMTEAEVRELLGPPHAEKAYYAYHDVQGEMAPGVSPKQGRKQLIERLKKEQPSPHRDVVVSQQDEWATHVEYSYELGFFLADYCSLQIEFDRAGKLTGSQAHCG